MLALFIGLLALVVAWTVAAVLAFRALIWIRGGHVPRRVGVGRCDGPVGWLAEVAMHRPLCIGRKRRSSDRWIRGGPKPLCRPQGELARLGLAFRERRGGGPDRLHGGRRQIAGEQLGDRGRELRRKTEGRGTRQNVTNPRES